MALLFLDLDRFKLVNDSLGHDAGDRLLCRVAERLKSLIRPSDTVARFGGDEFMVLCDQVEDDRQAILVAERLSGGLAEPFVLEGRELFVGASIGIAFGADRSATVGEPDPRRRPGHVPRRRSAAAATRWRTAPPRAAPPSG